MGDEQSLRILLIDDEEIVHQTLSPYLQDSGHQVDNVREGLKAIELIKAKEYDLALIDVRMPGMDGLSLLSRISEIRPDLSSVIITGHGNMEMVIQALRSGAADFLTKPIKLLELDAVLEKSIRLHQLRKDQRHLRETIRGLQTSEDIRLRNRCFVGVSKAMNEVRKQIGWSDNRVSLYHYRTTTGREVDILLENAAGQLVGLEVKASATVVRKDFSGLDTLSEDTGNKFVRGIVLYTGEQSVSFAENYLALPVSAIWRMTR